MGVEKKTWIFDLLFRNKQPYFFKNSPFSFYPSFFKKQRNSTQTTIRPMSYNCPVCAKNLTHLKENQRNEHVEDCLTAGNTLVSSQRQSTTEISTAGLLVACPHPDCMGLIYTSGNPNVNKMDCFHFPTHWKENHSTGSQAFACPICALESDIPYKITEKTNILHHLGQYHNYGFVPMQKQSFFPKNKLELPPQPPLATPTLGNHTSTNIKSSPLPFLSFNQTLPLQTEKSSPKPASSPPPIKPQISSDDELEDELAQFDFLEDEDLQQNNQNTNQQLGEDERELELAKERSIQEEMERIKIQMDEQKNNLGTQYAEAISNESHVKRECGICLETFQLGEICAHVIDRQFKFFLFSFGK